MIFDIGREFRQGAITDRAAARTPTTGFARKRIFGFRRKRLIFRTEARNVAAQGVFSTLCVSVHGISVRALSRASSEISETRHAFLSGEGVAEMKIQTGKM